MTPLFFKGSSEAKLKPFVPNSSRPSQTSSDELTIGLKKELVKSNQP